MAKYLITGITGFAGPHLARLLLSKNNEVHGIVRTANGTYTDLLDVLTVDEISSIKVHYCDLKHFYGVQKIINDGGYDGVFHLAAQSHPPTSFIDPIMTWQDNVLASVNLITSLQNSKTNRGDRTKLMFCSTSEVYGTGCEDNGILYETSALMPSNPYGSSKAAIDLYMQERMTNGYVDGFVTRAFSHTGPRRGKIFSISSDAYQIARMMLGQQDKTLLIGNLKTKRVVMDVRDCVEAYYLLMINHESSGKVFNVCGSDVHEMQFYTDTLIKCSKLDNVVQQIHKPFYRDIDIPVQIGNCNRLKCITNWTQKYTIEQTLMDLLDYWRKKLA